MSFCCLYKNFQYDSLFCQQFIKFLYIGGFEQFSPSLFSIFPFYRTDCFHFCFIYQLILHVSTAVSITRSILGINCDYFMPCSISYRVMNKREGSSQSVWKWWNSTSTFKSCPNGPCSELVRVMTGKALKRNHVPKGVHISGRWSCFVFWDRHRTNVIGTLCIVGCPFM